MKEMLSNYVLGAIACIVMGIALIINPHIITDVLNSAIGIILIVWAGLGVLKFIISRAKNPDSDASIFSLFGNLVMLIAGIYVLINTSLLEKIVMLALGLYLLCSGIPKIITSLKIKSAGAESWLTTFVTSVLTTVFGLLMVAAPTKVSGAFMRIAGIVLAVAGVVNFISGFSAKRAWRKIEKSANKSSTKVIDIDNYEEEK